MNQPFSYMGKVPASKSIYNRALVAASFSDHPLEIVGFSDSDDIELMKTGLESLKSFAPINCGHAGTVLRFLALRAARVPGEHVLNGSERLFSRPQSELIRIMSQLGVEAKLSEKELRIKSRGWRPMGDSLHVPTDRSSQFSSAVLLSSWNLSKHLYISIDQQVVSRPYWLMTVHLMKHFGLALDTWEKDFCIMAGQKPQIDRFSVEMDMSSAFTLAAVATVSGEAIIEDFPQTSWQPDSCFPEVLGQMGARIELDQGRLRVSQVEGLKGIEFNLGDCPDMFPVLSVLCALADGPSRLFGAEQLIYKESNRIGKMAELIQKMGRQVEVFNDGLIVKGPRTPIPKDRFNFETDQDHRLAMAAAVALKAGYPVQIINPEVISKSFLGFWQSLGIQP